MSKKQLTSAFGLLPKSTEVIKRNLGLYFILLVVPLLLSSITGNTTQPAPDAGFKELLESLQASITPYMIAGGVLSLLFFAPLTYTELKTAAGEQLTFSQALKGYKYFWKLIGLSIIVGLIIIIGLVLFIIPGLIMVRRYLLSPYFMMDKNLGIKQAMEASVDATKPVSWQIYSIMGVTLLFAFIAGFGVGGMIIGTILQVLYSAATALRYHEIK